MEGFFEKYQQLFLENVTGSKNGECVLWARKVQKTGYGAVKYKCPVTGRWKCTTAHRLSFMVGTKHLCIGDRDGLQCIVYKAGPFILDVARCYLWLFTLYINIKIGKNSC